MHTKRHSDTQLNNTHEIHDYMLLNEKHKQIIFN